jgi:uncharacterized zinc-type alcohol dehydrogenase-like protein
MQEPAMIPAKGFAAQSPTTPLAPYAFERRDLRPADVQIEILFCGVCHSDLHAARGEWGGVAYPLVPGHEIVGRVAAVGPHVSRFKEGDMVGVGCLVDSCRRCDGCSQGLEQYCDNGWTGTYMGIEKETGRPTNGGYSDKIVVDEAFVLRIPDGMDPASAAPLLCAGITTYSPLRWWEVGPQSVVGVVGLGGLGHMGVKLARAMGAHVTVFTTSPDKVEDAKRLGAHAVVMSREPAAMAAVAGKFDFILNTVAAPHQLDPFLSALKRDGTLCLVGVPAEPHPAPNVANLIFRRRSLAGSLIGGIPETQEMLDFCAANGLAADIELIPIQQINTAYERMLKSDVKYRFVIDMASLD